MSTIPYRCPVYRTTLQHRPGFSKGGNQGSPCGSLTDMSAHRRGPSPVPLLELRNIRKSFGAIEALRDVSFSVDRGEVVALLGDNGAGKSTLVKMISGGLAPSSGDIMFDGS